MIVVENENHVFVDVDQTLIQSMAPNDILVKKIIEWDSMGKFIIVWTSNCDGVRHAEKAVRLCNLEEYVDLVMVKPHTIVDDDHLEYYNTIDPDTLEYK